MPTSRRRFIAGIGAAAASNYGLSRWDRVAAAAPVPRISSTFRVGVISDEIAQDFGRACEVAAGEFGMEWVELRDLWNKNVLNLDSNEVAEARRILKKY